MSDAPMPRRQFASDNWAAICPEALAALHEANAGHAPSYGADPWTAEAVRLIREVFGTECEVFLVFNGTAANSLALASLCEPFESVLCHEHAHIANDECGAPGFFAHGTSLVPLAGAGGKLAPETIALAASRRSDVHHPSVRAVSLTQSTELGTAYTPAELRTLADTAHRLGLHLHMDGARFANAVASLGCKPREVTWEAGVDVLCFGGTKNGSPVGDAVVFFNRELAHEFDYRCKQSGQLASKMRFLSAPWVGMLKNNVWLRHAGHANAMATLMHDELVKLPELRLMFPRQANAVFVEMPPWLIVALRAAGWKFYTFIGQGGCRLMCAWDTTEQDVDEFTTDLKGLLVTGQG